jgi:hypothetical protein
VHQDGLVLAIEPCAGAGAFTCLDLCDLFTWTCSDFPLLLSIGASFFIDKAIRLRGTSISSTFTLTWKDHINPGR